MSAREWERPGMITEKPRLLLFAIRDAFITLLPLTFFRVLAELCLHLPIPAYHNAMTGIFGLGWTDAVRHLIEASIAAWSVGTAIAVAIFVHGQLARFDPAREALPSMIVGFSALVNFMLYALMEGQAGIPVFGYDAMFASILIGLGTAFILNITSRWRIPAPLHLSYDAEAVFFQAVRSCVPVAVTGLVVVMAIALRARVQFPMEMFVAPLTALEAEFGGGIWWFSLGATLLNQISWFLGAHGGIVIETFSDALFGLKGAAYSADIGYRPLFDTFVLLGGCGSTAGLLVAIMLTVREGSQLRIAKLAVLPSLFNINEILVFGLPLVLNPLYLLPFIGVPLLLALISVGAVQAGVIELRAVDVPWTTPPLISGWMITGSWTGVVFQAAEIALSAALYLPFVRMAERQRKRRQSRMVVEATTAILEERSRFPAISRRDDVGLIARGLLGDLRDAISRGGLELHYQPKMDRDGRVIGFEALLRWQHERHGALSPVLAVTLAEDGNAINELGGWVIDEACACKARWNTLGHKGLTMAFNISPIQLTDPDLPKRVARALARNGLSPSEIELEITESQAIPDNPQVDATFAGLMEIGIQLTMDDFGMGYSSLLYLRRFNVGSIKIDGSLSREVLSHEANADIIRSIASLGKSRGVTIVAEFVETGPQRDELARLGCDHFQGYLFSRPLPEAECAGFLQENSVGGMTGGPEVDRNRVAFQV